MPAGYGYTVCTNNTTAYLPTRNALLAWLNAEHATRRTFTTLILGYSVHGPRDLPPAQRSQLLKLRGTGIVEARIKLAGYLGVRVKTEASRIAAARAVVAAVGAVTCSDSGD